MSIKEKILVVDDDHFVIETLEAFLSAKGYLVDSADSGSRALGMMKKKVYDLVLSDMVMEDVGGLDLLREVKTKYPDIPFLLFTGYGSLDTAIEALRLGTYDYLQKPINYEELLLKVKSALEMARLKREKEAAEQEKDELLEKLKHYNISLEAMVEERTKAIKQSQETLRSSEKKYVRLVENSPDIIYMLNSEGRFSFVGGAVKSLLGLTSGDLMGKHFESIVWPEDATKAQFHLNERRTGKRATRGFELRLAVRGGKEKAFDIRYLTVELDAFGMYDKPVKKKDKKFLYTYGVARDISARKRVEVALEHMNKKLLMEYKQRKLLSKRLITLLENDRRQLAMELHDHVGQMLTALKMDLEVVLGEAKPDGAVFKESTQLAHDKALQAMEEIRNIARGLRPTTLDTLGLASSLRELFDDIKEHTDLEIHFFHKRLPRRLDPEKELAIYRIVQEALTNVVKHAHAEKVFVNLVREKKFITLGVEDAGVGFDKDKIMKISRGKGPLGLLIMQERAVQVDGEFSIESRIDGGTHLLARIPV